jgi:hypothetical protein
MPVIFENPNSPQQPQKGVYGWYARKGNQTITIYIGQAGNKKTCLPKGTLFRRVSELQKNTFTSDSPNYANLDTDFIVGTAIDFLVKNGYDCVWRHISDEPADEQIIVRRERPILQNVSADIKIQFKKIPCSIGKWKLNPELVDEAENKIFHVLQEMQIK